MIKTRKTKRKYCGLDSHIHNIVYRRIYSYFRVMYSDDRGITAAIYQCVLPIPYIMIRYITDIYPIDN